MVISTAHRRTGKTGQNGDWLTSMSRSWSASAQFSDT
jgi:hypothetical protein